VGSFPRALKPRHHEVTAQRLSKTTLWGPDAKPSCVFQNDFFGLSFFARYCQELFWNKPFLIEDVVAGEGTSLSGLAWHNIQQAEENEN
jgi:hypothetical protein